jgi:hypothetical protein
LRSILPKSSVVSRFLWAKGLNAKVIHKEMFPPYVGKCMSRKRIADDKEVETEVQKWLRQQSKYFYAAGFDALIKRWGKCVSV